MIGSHPVLRESNSALIHKLLPNCSWIAWRRCEKHQGVAHPKKEATKKESCGTKLETRSERWVKRARRDMYTQIYIYIYRNMYDTISYTHCKRPCLDNKNTPIPAKNMAQRTLPNRKPQRISVKQHFLLRHQFTKLTQHIQFFQNNSQKKPLKHQTYRFQKTQSTTYSI